MANNLDADGSWVVCLADGAAIGSVFLGDSGQLACLLGPAFWNRGFAREASRAVIDYAFRVLHHERVRATAATANLAPTRAMKRLGMQRTENGTYTMDNVDHLAHRNLGDFTRFVARLERGAVLFDDAGIVAAAGPGTFPTARQAVRTAPGDADEQADAIVGFYDTRGHAGTAFTRVGADDDLTQALAARGFDEWAQTPEMVCDAVLEPRRAAETYFATTPDDVAAYARIAGEAFTHLQIPADVTAHTLDNPEVMLQPDVLVALASLDGEPVAGAMVALLGPEPLAYVGWVAVADRARGRGLGDVVTRALTNEAFARGATMCTLEASHFGEHTYARMGYRELYRYRIMIRL